MYNVICDDSINEWQTRMFNEGEYKSDSCHVDDGDNRDWSVEKIWWKPETSHSVRQLVKWNLRKRERSFINSIDEFYNNLMCLFFFFFVLPKRKMNEAEYPKNPPNKITINLHLKKKLNKQLL